MADENKNRKPEDIVGKPLAYILPLKRDAAATDSEKKVIKLTFSSDKPIKHWFGDLILDHSPKAVLLDRLRSNGPFLKNHDWDNKLGRVRSAETNGKRCEAEVQITRNPQGEAFWLDYEDDLCTGVSVGFIVHEMILDKETDDEVTYRATSWEPFEISDADVPADCSVGYVREMSFATESNNQSSPIITPSAPVEEERAINTQTEENTMKTPANTADPQNQNQPTEVERAQDMIEFAEVFGNEYVELARDYAAEGRTMEEFRGAVREKRKAAQPVQPPVEEAKTVAERNGAGSQAVVISRNVHLKNFKGERAVETALRFGHFLRAALFGNAKSSSFCREQNIPLTRAAQTGSQNEYGGFLIPEEFEPVMIDLREKYGVFRKYANVVPMSTETKSRPRRKGGLTAYPIGAVGAGRAITESRKNWDRVSLNAKQWGVLVKYEEELDEDSVINLADDLAGEIAYAFTKIEDECGFIGDGSASYHGIEGVCTKIKGLDNTIANIAGLVVASGNAWSEIVKADILKVVGRLPEYADNENAKFYCSKTFWAEVLCNLSLTAGGVTAAEMESVRRKEFLGYEVVVTQTMPKTEANSQVCLLFGDLAKGVMFGDRKGLTIKMTDSNDTDFEEGLISIKGTERFDIVVHDVGNASGTANLRVPGPIVGLITAAS